MYQKNPLLITEGPHNVLKLQHNMYANAAKSAAAKTAKATKSGAKKIKIGGRKIKDGFLDFIMGRKRSMGDNLAFSGKAFV